jgi:hypothetical protein
MPGTGHAPVSGIFSFDLGHLMLVRFAAPRPGTLQALAALWVSRGGLAMRYRVFSGPPGSGPVSPLEKERLLFKEFDSLDGALAWARHLQENGRVALSIDGDDGTNMSKQEIAAALRHSENERFPS